MSTPLGEDFAAVAFLQSAQLCRGLSDEQMDELIATGELQSFAPLAVVIEAGECDDGLFIIFDGRVSVRAQTSEGWVELAQLLRGQIFGEIAVLTQQPRTNRVIATGDVRLLRLRGEVVRRVADAEPKFGRRLAALMAGRSRDTARKLEQ